MTMIPAPRGPAPSWNDTPRVTWHLEPGIDLGSLTRLEVMVPGLRVLSHVVGERRGSWPQRAEKVIAAGEMPDQAPIVVVPMTAWWLAESAIQDLGMRASEPYWHKMVEPWPEDPDEVARFDARGQALFDDAVAAGRVSSEFRPLKYQIRNLAWSLDACPGSAGSGPRPFNLIIWPTGSGKTKGAALEAAARGGAVLVVGPGKARRAWEKQAPAVLGRRVFRHYPASDWAVGTVGLDEYLHACERGYDPPRVDRRDLSVAVYAEAPTREAEVRFLTERLRGTVTVLGFGPLAGLVARAAEAGRCKAGIVVQATAGRELRLAVADAVAGSEPPSVFIAFHGPRPGLEVAYIREACARNGVRFESVAIGSRPAVPPFVIIGAESVSQTVEVARRVRPETVILDEIQVFGNPSRKKMRRGRDGEQIFETKRTASGAADVQAAAIADICHAKWVKHRIGISAMPVEAGLPRRLWSVFDLLDPGCFGSYRNAFVPRYCYNEQEPYHSYTGFMNDDGARFIDELRSRGSYYLHEVTHSESHGALPPTTVEFPWLDGSELSKPGAGYGDARRALARSGAGAGGAGSGDADLLAELLREFDIDPEASDAGPGRWVDRERLTLELELSAACEAKLGWVRYQVLEALRGWAAVVRPGSTAQVFVDGAHGGVPERDREEMVERFEQHQGPALLVVTEQAFGMSVDGLQVATRGICAAFPWRIASFIQLKGRFDRILNGLRVWPKVIVFVNRRRIADQWLGILRADVDRWLRSDEVGGRLTLAPETHMAGAWRLDTEPGAEPDDRLVVTDNACTLLTAPVASGTYDEVIVDRLAKQAGLVQGLHRAEELDGLAERLLDMEDADLEAMTMAALGLG